MNFIFLILFVLGALITPLTFAQQTVMNAIQKKEEIARQTARTTGQHDVAKYFIAVAPGVIKDTRTGLEWMRCSLGQNWSETAKTCEGKVNAYDKGTADAMVKAINKAGGYAKHTDWRIPSVRELASLRYCSAGFGLVEKNIQDGKGTVPKICEISNKDTRATISPTVFPNTTTNAWYWTNSRYVGLAGGAWIIDFSTGDIDRDTFHSFGAVRLVRALSR
ncbi:MAG: DUF1566 domain-containing protein [Rhodoferax sp.]|jgi:hypothetical protein|nr:DUF1566 domain-containing protein [Rhodoferax sp.]